MKLRIDQFFALFFCGLLVLLHGVFSTDAIADTDLHLSTLGISHHQSFENLLSITLVEEEVAPIVLTSSLETSDKTSESAKVVSINLTGFNKDADKLAEFLQTLDFRVTAKSYLIVDLDSAAVLKSKNPHMKIHPASAVKLMTALLAREIFSLDETITTTLETKVTGNRIGFVPDGELTVADTIAACLIFSANDAAALLAQHHPNGYPAFVQEMNRKAQELSLRQTFFVNPSGIDDSRQLSSSWDLSLLARELLKDFFLSELVRTEYRPIWDQKNLFQYHLYNTNQLLYSQEKVVGVKTGTTELAGEVLLTVWQDQGKSILVVVVGSENRYQDTMLLAEWVENMVRWE